MATTIPAPRADHATVVSFRGAGKCFHLRPTRPFLLREAWQAVLGKRERGREFWALRDVSLDVRAGESVAFMGANGAGKSTLLGLIAKTITPTTGRVDVRGRVGALLELGAGFHPDLTGRENIYLNASLLGMQRAEVEGLYDRIVDFSELHEFIDQPLRSYSSGMQVRLGFSVAIHLDPDVLIMDEVLAVGDQSFQHKCVVRIDQLHNQGKTLLFVSHTPDVVRTLCQRVVWLDHGRVRKDGGVAEVLAEYEASAT